MPDGEHATAEAFRDQSIRTMPACWKSKPRARATPAGLQLVENEESPMRMRQAAQARGRPAGGRIVPASP